MHSQYVSQFAISFFKCCFPKPFWRVQATSPLLFPGRISFPHYGCCTWGQQMGGTLRPSSARVCILQNTSGQLGLSQSRIKLILQLSLLLQSQRKMKEEWLKDGWFLLYLCDLESLALTALAERCSDCRTKMLKLSRAAFSTATHHVRVEQASIVTF